MTKRSGSGKTNAFGWAGPWTPDHGDAAPRRLMILDVQQGGAHLRYRYGAGGLVPANLGAQGFAGEAQWHHGTADGGGGHDLGRHVQNFFLPVHPGPVMADGQSYMPLAQGDVDFAASSHCTSAPKYSEMTRMGTKVRSLTMRGGSSATTVSPLMMMVMSVASHPAQGEGEHHYDG